MVSGWNKNGRYPSLLARISAEVKRRRNATIEFDTTYWGSKLTRCFVRKERWERTFWRLERSQQCQIVQSSTGLWIGYDDFFDQRFECVRKVFILRVCEDMTTHAKAVLQLTTKGSNPAACRV